MSWGKLPVPLSAAVSVYFLLWFKGQRDVRLTWVGNFPMLAQYCTEILGTAQLLLIQLRSQLIC